MYHKDKDGEKYHIGNIIELDNMITFTFDLPTGMKEIQSGEHFCTGSEVERDNLVAEGWCYECIGFYSSWK